MAGSPPLEFSSAWSSRTPPRTLLDAEAGDSGVPAVSDRLIQSHVPGRICMTPTAPAEDTSSLFQPLSCQPTASASDPGTPLAAAIWLISEPLTRSAVGYGGAP